MLAGARDKGGGFVWGTAVGAVDLAAERKGSPVPEAPIVAIGLLTRHDLERLGESFQGAIPGFGSIFR